MNVRYPLVVACAALLGTFAFAGCSSGDTVPGSGVSSSGGSYHSGSSSGSSSSGGSHSSSSGSSSGSSGGSSSGSSGGSSSGTTSSSGSSSGTASSSGSSSGSGSGSSSGTPVEAGAGTLPFASPCTASAQCQSGDCFNFPANGQFCTQPCNGVGDGPCPNGLACNGMNQCKVQ